MRVIKLNILVAEDSKYYRKYMEETLEKWGYSVIFAEDGEKAWQILQTDDGPQLVLLNWEMPKLTGLDVCYQVRMNELNKYVYLILLTSHASQEDIIKGLEAGADDYVVKPFHDQELKSRLKIGERIIKLENSIRKMALIDPLTGLLNRRAFNSRLESELERCVRNKSTLSLLLFDIDNFKKINDTYGHQCGDSVLYGISQQAKTFLRGYDFISRFGGEEFIICLPDVNQTQAMVIAERLRTGIENLKIETNSADRSIQVTASFGLYTIHSGEKHNIEYIIRQADQAMYRAKNKGKNCICCA